jgi:hypothetical protein
VIYLDHASTGKVKKFEGHGRRRRGVRLLRHMPHTLKNEHFFFQAVPQKSRELAATLIECERDRVTTNTSHGSSNLAACAASACRR